jgi:hypothetical protein
MLFLKNGQSQKAVILRFYSIRHFFLIARAAKEAIRMLKIIFRHNNTAPPFPLSASKARFEAGAKRTGSYENMSVLRCRVSKIKSAHRKRLCFIPSGTPADVARDI